MGKFDCVEEKEGAALLLVREGYNRVFQGDCALCYYVVVYGMRGIERCT